jgi:Golgi SNAP receptor complex protein 2
MAAATLTAHHASARKIVLAVDTLLEQLETGRDTSLSLQSEISQHLNMLAREVQALEEQVPMVGALAERSLWKKRIVQLQEQSKSQRAALGKFASRAAARQREHEDREALLQRRNGGGDYAINIDAMARESRGLNESSAQLDAMHESAANSLAALIHQRSNLKGVQKKVLDLAATLGLSNSVLRAIERRQTFDKIIVYGYARDDTRGRSNLPALRRCLGLPCCARVP